MAFDYKKEYRAFYLPPKKPGLVTVPPMQYLAVTGTGDPNEPEGAFHLAIEMLYVVAYTIKMSPKAGKEIEGFFDFVVPPLEGLWWQAGACGVDWKRKQDFSWQAMIRLPDFVQESDVIWAVAEADRKKKRDFSPVKFLQLEEGTCVQCMHIGAYDEEDQTIARMEAFAAQAGYTLDYTPSRRHHEIYLSDARKTDPSRLRTVIRLPVKPCASADAVVPDDLQQIPGVGKAISQDLRELGIRCIADLKGRDPEELYLQECLQKGYQQDRCQLYVYRLAVYYAEHTEHAPEKLKWWYWKDKPYPEHKETQLDTESK